MPAHCIFTSNLRMNQVKSYCANVDINNNSYWPGSSWKCVGPISLRLPPCLLDSVRFLLVHILVSASPISVQFPSVHWRVIIYSNLVNCAHLSRMSYAIITTHSHRFIGPSFRSDKSRSQRNLRLYVDWMSFFSIFGSFPKIEKKLIQSTNFPSPMEWECQSEVRCCDLRPVVSFSTQGPHLLKL